MPVVHVSLLCLRSPPVAHTFYPRKPPTPSLSRGSATSFFENKTWLSCLYLQAAPHQVFSDLLLDQAPGCRHPSHTCVEALSLAGEWQVSPNKVQVHFQATVSKQLAIPDGLGFSDLLPCSFLTWICENPGCHKVIFCHSKSAYEKTKKFIASPTQWDGWLR